MSVVEKSKFKCPHCGEEFEADMYKSVSVNDGLNYRDMLINGDYFKYTCPKCEKKFLAIYPLSYTDLNNKFVLQFAPSKIKDEILSAVKENRNTVPSDFTIRVCTATNDLTEKMIIFENRFDDRAIECMKVVVHRAFLRKFNDKPVTHIYLNVDKDGKYCFDVLFQEEENKEAISRAIFDMKLYNKIYHDFRKHFKDDDLFVDYGYGLNLMVEMNKEQQADNKEENK